MSEEEIKEIAREEILDTIKSKLDSSMIFTYTNGLEQENKQLKERFENLVQEHIDTINRNEEKQQKIDKAIEYIKEHTKETNFDNDKLIDILEILGDKE